MMIIVGLGNPGKQYEHSRHNMGWRICEALGHRQQATGEGDWNLEKSLEAEIFHVDGALLVKPQTFMNLSGTAVKAVLKKYDYASLGKKDFHNLFAIYDDLDIEVGKYKIIFGSGPKVHNGVNDITEKLGTDQYWHIRIGVDGRNGDRSQDPADYVLDGLREEEQVLIEKVMDSVVDLLSQKMMASP